MVIFKETSIFTRQILELISDDEYAGLQRLLVRNPAAGRLIQRSGGIRKIRWMVQGKGKRGGIRVMYYWAKSEEEIYMLYAYKKGDIADLTPKQVEMLAALVKEEFE